LEIRRALIVAACSIAFALPGTRCLLAQNAPNADPFAAACGAEHASFKTKQDGPGTGLTTPPAGKALVYVIEQMPQVGLFTTHVNVGVDGQWIAQLSSLTFTSFALDPGVHHLCAVYQGQLASSDIGPTILHRLNVQAGKTYYFLYRGLISAQSQEVGFLDEVDEDEGGFVLQTSQHVTSTVEKK
jgi:hypothetical protein